jgi:hypothetical protein
LQLAYAIFKLAYAIFTAVAAAGPLLQSHQDRYKENKNPKDKPENHDVYKVNWFNNPRSIQNRP